MSGRFSLRGRTALVTGSSRGIGRAIAQGMAEHGASVAVHCQSRMAEAEEVAAAIEGMGCRSVALRADLRDREAVEGLPAAAAAALGSPVDILVLNASSETREPLDGVSDAAFAEMVDVNLRATLHLVRLCIPSMQGRGWGRVVMLGSIQQFKPNPTMLVYAATKAAQSNIARNLARQVAGHGITVNTIAPGAIATDRNAGVLADGAYRTRVEAMIPSGRVGVPEDCVGAAILLCSDAGAYINGIDLNVDGGWAVS